MNACQECKYFTPDSFFMKGLFKNKLSSVAINYGVCGVNTQLCKTNRDLKHLCGINGVWFTPAKGKQND